MTGILPPRSQRDPDDTVRSDEPEPPELGPEGHPQVPSFSREPNQDVLSTTSNIMKNLLLSFAIVGLAVACRSTDNTTVSDAEGVNAPGDCASVCDEAAKAECAEAKADCGQAAKAECSEAAKAACSEAKVCPVTGKEIE